MYDKAAPAEPLTPMELLARAVASGATIEVLTGLMDLQERYERAQERREASQALKAFDEAIAAAKAEIPVIVKGTQGHNYVYADFAAIARVVDPILSSHGLQYRFRTVQTDKAITVTCVLFGHGHKEECTLSGGADTSGQKNAIQSIGSTLTYLQRYTLVQMLGLATAKDDDGRGGGGGVGDITGPINEFQLERLTQLCSETLTDEEAFCAYFKIDTVADLPAKDYGRALVVFEKKKVAIARAKEEADGKTDQPG
jgi:uncharacterized protein YyaL (SSP411 family)